MALTDDDIEFRRNIVGGSDVTILMSGDQEDINDLAMIKLGQKKPPNLTRVLQVQMGNWTENHNLNWFEMMTGRRVTNRQDQFFTLEYPWMAATVDGLTDNGSTVIDAKHVSGFQKKDVTRDKYFWQLQHNMIVTGLHRAVLSVFFGTTGWEAFEIEEDPIAQEQLIDVERQFWEAVKRGELPFPIEAPDVPTKAVKVEDMSSSNEWGAAATDWLATQAQAKTFEKAAKTLKGLVKADVKVAFGHGVTAKRNAAGALSISESNDG